MGRKSLIGLSVVTLTAFIISGCGTSQKKVQSEVTGIKTRVETLESRVEGVESKQADVERTTAEQAQALDELKSARTSQPNTNISVKHREGAGVQLDFEGLRDGAGREARAEDAVVPRDGGVQEARPGRVQRDRVEAARRGEVHGLVAVNPIRLIAEDGEVVRDVRVVRGGPRLRVGADDLRALHEERRGEDGGARGVADFQIPNQ